MAKPELGRLSERVHGEEGGLALRAPEMLVSVWLYAYARSVTSSLGWRDGSGRIWRFAIWQAVRGRITGR